MTKKTIYKRLYIEIDTFMKELPSQFKDKMGVLHFYFNFNDFAYKNGRLICGEYSNVDNSITFFLENIKRANITGKKDIKKLIKHEMGHVFGVSEERLPQFT